MTRAESRWGWVIRPGPVAAWGSVAVTVACVAGATYLGPRTSGVLGPAEGFQGRPTDVVWLVSWLGFPIVGAVLLSSRSRNAIGWILCGIGLSVGVGVFATVYARYALAVDPGALPGGRAAAWIATVTSDAAVLVAFLVFLFPSGRVGSPGLRRVLRVAVAASLAFVLWNGFSPGPIDGVEGPGRVDNPLGVDALRGSSVGGRVALAWVIAAFAAVAIVRAVVRLWTARGDERQQLKWFAFSAALFPVTMVIALLRDPDLAGLMGRMLEGTAMGTETGSWGLPIAFLLSFTGMSTSIGVAIFRYRLYEIDRIIHRTLVYTVLSAGLVGLYAATVVALQATTRPLTGSDDLAIAASTLLVAAAFYPVRERVQRFVDRRFNRSRYDAQRAVEAFSARLRDEVDLTALRAEIGQVVTRTVQPSSVWIWVGGAR